MKVVAALWFESPGAHAENETFRSVQEVLDEFASMRDTWNRYGGSKPVGVIYHPDSLDYPMYTLEVSDRGATRKTRA